MRVSSNSRITSELASVIKERLMLAVVICLAIQVWSTPSVSAEDNSAGTAKFDHSEYMKATSAGQKKAEPAVKGMLCFESAHKTVNFLDSNGSPAFSIQYDAIESILYEQTEKPRYTEAVLISPLFIFSHSRKHYLTIQYKDPGGMRQFVIFHLDKKNAREVVATAESETGKKVERVEEK